MFSWSKRPSTSAYPAARAGLQSNGTVVAQAVQGSIRPPIYTRSQHLDSFLNDAILKRSTRRISADDTTFDTVFQTTGGETLILRINVPPTAHSSAPCGAPSMTLVGVKARHSWLDNRMRVRGYAPIQSDTAWRNASILLGPAVHEVVKHLQLNPPTIVEITDNGLRKIQSDIQSKMQSNAAGGSRASESTPFPANPPQHQQQSDAAPEAPPNYETLLNTPVVDMPPVPTHFPLLDELSRDQLQNALDDPIAFMAFVNTLPSMQTLQTMAISSIDQGAKTAEKHLDKKASYTRLHEEVTTLQSTLKEKLETFRGLEEQQNDLCVEADAHDLVKQLNRAKKRALDESEEYAEEWVEGNGDGESVNQFLKTFLEKRRIHHERAAKMEILQHHGHQ